MILSEIPYWYSTQKRMSGTSPLDLCSCVCRVSWVLIFHLGIHDSYLSIYWYAYANQVLGEGFRNNTNVCCTVNGCLGNKGDLQEGLFKISYRLILH